MSKQVYISADYADGDSGDRNVVALLKKWGDDNIHKVDFIDMSNVASGSVTSNPDCRICELKHEFNRQINASSTVIFVVGDKTASRTAGSSCQRASEKQENCSCTPYKQNTYGSKPCKVYFTHTAGEDEDLGNINTYSYLRHEFEQAKKKHKNIGIVYNSTRFESNWLPEYMNGYEEKAQPFWKMDNYGNKVGNYLYIKGLLEF